MEGVLPGWLIDGAQVVGLGAAFWLLFEWRKETRATLAEAKAAHRTEIEGKDRRIEKLEAANADLNDKLVGAYRETLPALTQSARAVEAIADVLPTIAATEPARLTGGKSR